MPTSVDLEKETASTLLFITLVRLCKEKATCIKIVYLAGYNTAIPLMVIPCRVHQFGRRASRNICAETSAEMRRN